MSIGTLTPRGRRITVDFDPTIADRIAEEAASRSTLYRRFTASDIVREAVVRFLLPNEGTDGSHLGTDTTEPSGETESDR